MTRLAKLKKFFIFAAILFLTGTIYAESVSDPKYNYSLDLPEGYEVKDYNKDGTGYFFQHPNIPVSLVLKITEEKNSSSNLVLKEALKKLSAKNDADNFKWNKKECSVASFSMYLDQGYAGWALSAPLTINDFYITLICYAPEDKEKACEQFIFSTLNSLCTDMEYYSYPGIIVSYAFPKEGSKNITLDINGIKVHSLIDKVDEEASQWVVDLEYSVLTLYGRHNMWKEAWQRYYRMIYRDSFGRLENISSDIYDALYFTAKTKNPSNPQIYYAQLLLSWVQSFDYFRGEKSSDSDFTNLVSSVCGTGNDCDSRSMLLAVLLKACGIETIMLFSPEYSHALAAVLIDAPGQTFKLPGTKLEFLMGETTAPVTWGMISQDQADRSKWIEVLFP